jgi:RimJ/RimL family protein N-acetyltransferase
VPPLPDPPPTLTDDRVALRLAQDRDIPEILIAHQDDRSLAPALGLPRPPRGAELGRRVETSAAQRAAGEELWLTVTAAGSDECRGQLELTSVDPEHRSGVLTLWIAPLDRRRGLGAAALALAGRWLLTDGGLARVALLAPPGNAALRGAAQRAGYHAEGILRGEALGAGAIGGAGGRVDIEVHSLVVADL